MNIRNKEIFKLILLILLILALPLIFISTEIMHKIQALSEIDMSNISVSTLDQAYNNILSTPKNTDPSTIRKCLSEIFTTINEKDYYSLYNLLTEEFKEKFFPTFESFNDYMINYLGETKYSPKFSSYKKFIKDDISIFIVPIDFLPYSLDEENITTNVEPLMTSTFTLYIKEDSSYNIALFSYIGTKKNKSVFENDVLKCSLVNTHLYTSQTTFDIEITNKTNSNLFIGENEIYVYTGLVKKYYPNSVFIPANSSSVIEFNVYTGLNLKGALPSELYFYAIHIDDTAYLFKLPIEYPINLKEIY